MHRAWKDISLSGGYRKMMTRPLGQVNAEVKAYSQPDEQMVQTDMEKLEGVKPSAVISEATDNVTNDKLAVILTLQLGSSQYATMAIRELSKGGASSFTPDFSSVNK
jgi:tRNA pseudouridine13 synthase